MFFGKIGSFRQYKYLAHYRADSFDCNCFKTDTAKANNLQFQIPNRMMP